MDYVEEKEEDKEKFGDHCLCWKIKNKRVTAIVNEKLEINEIKPGACIVNGAFSSSADI